MIWGNHKGLPLRQMMIGRGNPLWLPNLQSEIILMIVFHIKLIYDIGLNKTGIAYMQSL